MQATEQFKHVVHQPLPVQEFMSKTSTARIEAIRNHNMNYLDNKTTEMWAGRKMLVQEFLKDA